MLGPTFFGTREYRNVVTGIILVWVSHSCVALIDKYKEYHRGEVNMNRTPESSNEFLQWYFSLIANLVGSKTELQALPCYTCGIRSTHSGPWHTSVACCRTDWKGW